MVNFLCALGVYNDRRRYLDKKMRQKVTSNKVVIYLRVSTDEQGKSGLGIDAQLELCKSVCEQFKYEIVEIFTEIGVSGKIQPLERPEFKKAIALSRKINSRIMVAKLDRLSRNLHQATGFLDGVYDCPDILIAENPTSSMLELRLKALIAQEERDMISARTKAALAARKERGAIPNGTVAREIATIKAQSATEQAMTRAKELLNQGYEYTKIAEMLNTEGFTTSRGSAWSKQSLYKRLKCTRT
jgi:DNA invertase Pin-like site-specific DNA recombinase